MEKMKVTLAKIMPLMIKLLAVVGVLAILAIIAFPIVRSFYRPDYSVIKRLSDRFDRDNDDWKKKGHRISLDSNMDYDVSADKLCNLYPKEEVCVSWRETQKCVLDDKCAENMDEDDSMWTDEDDVLACFVSSDQMLDDDTLNSLPSDCRSFKFLDLEEIWGKESAPSPFRKIELSGSEQEWSQKITPGHLAGIARALRLIITENEEINEDLAPVLPLLDSFEMFEENGADKEMATGLFIGLYNSAVTGGEIAKKRVSEENRAYCAGLKEKMIPVRCRIQK